MLPRIVGTIERRILLNYRAPADLVQARVPSPLRVRSVNGYALVGVCLIRFNTLRPNGLPAAVGVSSENAAHRISVEWESGGVARTGVYVLRRDTDSYFIKLTGGRLFPGVHGTAKFVFDEQGDRLALSIRDAQGDLIRLRGTTKIGAFESHVFADASNASAFFEQDRIGYSPARTHGELEGLELTCHVWRTQPLFIEESFVRDFAEWSSEIIYDHALLMRNIPHHWSEIGNLCCES